MNVYRILAQPPGPMRLGCSVWFKPSGWDSSHGKAPDSAATFQFSTLLLLMRFSMLLHRKATVQLGKSIELGKFPFHTFQPKKTAVPVTTKSIGFLNTRGLQRFLLGGGDINHPSKAVEILFFSRRQESMLITLESQKGFGTVSDDAFRGG